MAYEDKILECVDCGKSFTFSAAEQEFYASKGFENDPKRCPECRQSRKQERSQGYRRPREMHVAICAECGAECEVPFEPRDGRPVYCSNCFNRRR